MVLKIKAYYPEIIGASLCLILGILSGYGIKAADSFWYLNLTKPSFNTPGWVFGPVWTLLYLMMGVAFGKLWKEKVQNKFLIILFLIQFIFNLLWSPLFFYCESIQWALIDILALWVSLIVLIFLSWSKRTVFLLLLPYLIWVSFAVGLNFSLYQLNVMP